MGFDDDEFDLSATFVPGDRVYVMTPGCSGVVLGILKHGNFSFQHRVVVTSPRSRSGQCDVEFRYVILISRKQKKPCNGT